MLPDVATDTIVAPSTAFGPAALAVVRLGGPSARAILQRLFHPSNPHTAFPVPRRLTLGVLVDPNGDVLDECMAVMMPAPRSYTGEDVAEIHCHGGPAVVAAVVQACIAAGARAAEPGEFTRRAFLNGRMDLTRAEAVADLVAAQTRLAGAVALRQLRGQLAARLESMYSSLADIAADIEARIDFADEEIPAADVAALGVRLRVVLADVRLLLDGYARGRIVREGARVVIAGPPNAGKSSLFNALLGRERAIVTPHPGTTRDTIESTVDIHGLAVTLVDTAGLREAGEEIERLGIDRARAEIRDADLVLLVLDGAQPQAGCVDTCEAAAAARTISVLNKIDLLQNAGGGEDVPVADVRVSSVTREGFETLERAIAGALGEAPRGDDEVLLTNARHAACLQETVLAAERACATLDAGLPLELVMVDLRAAIHHVGEILGRTAGDEILDRIFASFCIGK